MLNGYTIGQFQRCKRPLAISRTHSLAQWRPQTLLGMCLRHAIYELSNGKSLEHAAVAAVNHFLHNAKDPGLDVAGIDTYALSMDYCAIIRNVLEYLSRLSLLTLKDIPPLKLPNGLLWHFLSHQDETGTLHRWKFVDHLDEDPVAELHGWEVFGDIAAADVPMQLHLIAIGQRKGSHQHSPWCRVYSHPKLANLYRFQKVKGELGGEWKPVWFSGNSKNNPKDWVDMMLRDKVFEGIIRHINVKEVSTKHRARFFRDVEVESEQMDDIISNKVDPSDLPMSRYACDHPYTCPHQLFCYGSSSLDDAGIYVRRDKVQHGHT